MRDEENIFINESENKEEEGIMKYRLSTTLALVILTMALAAAMARAQTVANGPYYASPSWDQTLPVATRFIVLSNFNSEAVLDRETGLVWEKTPSASTFTQNNANRHCQHLTTGGRMGWRMPQTAELFSLLDPSQINNSFGSPAALPIGHPFVGTGGGVAFRLNDRAAPPFNNNAQLLALFLHLANINNVPDEGFFGRVWCVRGPGGSPTPW
jgi:hypothetical protein